MNIPNSKFKQIEIVLKLGSLFKSKSKFTNSIFGRGSSPLDSLPVLCSGPTGELEQPQTPGQIFCLSIILKYPPIKICSDNTELKGGKGYFCDQDELKIDKSFPDFRHI